MNLEKNPFYLGHQLIFSLGFEGLVGECSCGHPIGELRPHQDPYPLIQQWAGHTIDTSGAGETPT